VFPAGAYIPAGNLPSQMKNQEQTNVFLNAKGIGFTARQVCTQQPKGKVLASVTDTIYLESGSDDLIWIIGENEPLHRRSIRVQGLTPRVMEGSEVLIHADQIVFDSGLKIELSGASEWQPKTLERSEIFSITSIYQKTRDIYADLANIQGKGFGSFIPEILKIMEDPSKGKTPELKDLVLKKAWTFIPDIAQESSRHNFDMVLEKVEGLLGLGTGLTPSGDDFIGGLFFALHHLRNAYPREINFSKPYLREFVDRSRKKTNRVSFILMQDMSLGHGLAPLHEMMNSMVTNRPNNSTVTSMLELAKVGNSTGWDILTGVLAGLVSTRSFSKECN
jgi:hypothetical protein